MVSATVLGTNAAPALLRWIRSAQPGVSARQRSRSRWRPGSDRVNGMADSRDIERSSAFSPSTSTTMQRTLALAMWFQVLAGSLAAQDEAALRSYFEGKVVQVKLALPADEAGVDVYPRASPPIDYSAHAKRLKKYGIALEAGQSALVTKLKVKGSLIEFQLDGGGYGTSGDQTNPTVAVAVVPKSQREKDLEAALATETDP